MAWRDDLLVLRSEVETALTRILGEPVEEDSEVVQEREELYELANSLQVAQLLLDINEVVLSGTGRVESTSLMEYYDDENILYTMEDLEERMTKTRMRTRETKRNSMTTRNSGFLSSGMTPPNAPWTWNWASPAAAFTCW